LTFSNKLSVHNVCWVAEAAGSIVIVECGAHIPEDDGDWLAIVFYQVCYLSLQFFSQFLEPLRNCLTASILLAVYAQEQEGCDLST